MSEHLSQTPEHDVPVEVARDLAFEGFEWREDVPETFTIGKECFFSDETSLYMVRRVLAKAERADAAVAEDLFHGKGPSWHNATQGAGLYVTNTVQDAERVSYAAAGNKENRYYVLRVPKENVAYLDATTPEVTGSRQKLARGVLSAMATVPGMPWPTPKMYDWMYEDHDVVIFKPSAMQRRPAAKVGDEKLPQRYALLRRPELADIVAVR